MVDCVSGSGRYQFNSMLNPWNGMGPWVTVGSAPIKLRDNWLVSSSSDRDNDGDSAKRKDLLRVVVVVSSLSRSSMRDRGGSLTFVTTLL